MRLAHPLIDFRFDIINVFYRFSCACCYAGVWWSCRVRDNLQMPDDLPK